jgi:hypothetical protein
MTPDLTDAKLLERAVRNARDPASRGYRPRWVCVMAAFGLGSTFAAELCRRFDLDPGEQVRARDPVARPDQ